MAWIRVNPTSVIRSDSIWGLTVDSNVRTSEKHSLWTSEIHANVMAHNHQFLIFSTYENPTEKTSSKEDYEKFNIKCESLREEYMKKILKILDDEKSTSEILDFALLLSAKNLPYARYEPVE
jgi:hypothetical protein